MRIIRACQELGIQTVLLHSEPDVHTLAYRLADRRVCIGGVPLAETYLNIQRTIDGALAGGADAIHPGFGFLSENADFAQACFQAGLVFIGPSPEAIRALGDKISAKDIVQKAKAPTVPGYAGSDQSIETLIREVERIGPPVIVKAAAGGGGRGMKLIESLTEAQSQIEAAQREAKAAFGSASVFLEKYLNRAKHIEFQIFSDCTGRTVHLFERECSVQRRHQKIIEEACAASLSQELRNKMGQCAVELASAANYSGAGTVEFLVQDGEFYFLEMNTRLQVEHPVTELVLGVDLVKAQILNAAGEFAVWEQDELRPRGHSIECRIYAEDPFAGGIPSTGEILAMEFPHGPGRRFEVGLEPGDEVTPFYDPMVAKIVVWDETRLRAIRKMQAVLSDTVILGVSTNIPFLKAMLAHPEFINGTMTTQFVAKNFTRTDGLIGLDEELNPDEKASFEAELARRSEIQFGAASIADSSSKTDWVDPIRSLGWRLM